MRGGRLWLAALGVLALFLAGWWAIGARAGTAGEMRVVRRGELVREVEVTGTLEAVRASILSPPQVSGVWEYKVTFLAPEGEVVEAGAPVVGFDTTELSQLLQQRRNHAEEAAKELERTSAELARSKADLALEKAEAESEVRRQRLASGLPPELEARVEREQKSLTLRLAEEKRAHVERKIAHEQDRARAETTSLRERELRARARVAELEAAITRMTVAAPRRGTVIYSRNRGRDEKVKVGDSVWRGRAVVEIPDLTAMRAAGEVEEADIGRVELGRPARFILDAHHGQEYTARVEELGSAVTSEASGGRGKVVPVLLSLTETDPGRMRPGMRFRGWVETERAEGVLLLAADSVRLTPEGPHALRRSWLGKEEVPLVLGRRNGTDVEVLEGLEEGDRVLRLRGGEEGR